MSMRMLAIVVVVSLSLTTPSVCGQETPGQVGMPVMIKFAEHAPAGGQDEVEGPEIRERVANLLAEAEEMEARAGKLRAEARELERALAGRREAMDEDAHVREMRRKVDAMKEVAGHFEKEGHHEAAREIREKADTLARELEQRDERAGGERRREDGEQRDKKRVADLWTRVEDIRVKLKPDDDGRESVERLERKLAALNEAAERAAHAGREGEARELRMEAERVAGELEEHHKHVKRAELQEAEQHLENLQREMQEARERGEGERLARLEREAEEVGRMLQREREQREMAEHMENMHRELEELNRTAERAESDGHHDLARELHNKAMEVAEQIERQQREMEERHLQEARQRLEHLHVDAREAREQGRHEEAERMMAEAEEIERHLRAGGERRRMDEQMRRLHRLVEELTGSYHRALEEGRFDRAEGLRSMVDRMADMVAGELREDSPEPYEPAPERAGGSGMREIRVLIRPRGGDAEADREEADAPRMNIEEQGGKPADVGGDVWDVGERSRRLRARAREADEAGNHDEARALLTEAEQLERFLLSMEKPEDVAAPPAEVPADDEVSKLRKEVRQLRRDMEDLVNALRRRIGDF